MNEKGALMNMNMNIIQFNPYEFEYSSIELEP